MALLTSLGAVCIHYTHQGMAKNLAASGRKLVVWNRSTDKAADFAKTASCEYAKTPREVIEKVC
jgi:3-hydroxyisobutyrate dehydrogenase-like beta-hydroxyacid dehydrogenase